MKSFGAAILSVAFVCAALAQGPAGMPGPPRGEFGRGFGFGMHHDTVFSGAPYSATLTNSVSETLGDGNIIQRTTSGSVARDSQGRSYEQITLSGGPLGQSGPATLTFVTDPIAGYSYTLDPTTKVASRQALRAWPKGGARPPHGPGRGEGTRGSANRVETDLGTQTIGGVSATGRSISFTIAAGAIGNAQPIVSTSETWYSPDLQIPVLAKRNDPRSGQSTYSLTNIQRVEPAASLFQVPSDYTVRDAPAHGPPPVR